MSNPYDTDADRAFQAKYSKIMPRRRVEIKLTFTVDLDSVPGFGYEPNSWCEYLQAQLLQNAHYNPAIVITDINVKGQ